jgi:hypothetical protein
MEVFMRSAALRRLVDLALLGFLVWMAYKGWAYEAFRDSPAYVVCASVSGSIAVGLILISFGYAVVGRPPYRARLIAMLALFNVSLLGVLVCWLIAIIDQWPNVWFRFMAIGFTVAVMAVGNWIGWIARRAQQPFIEQNA